MKENHRKYDRSSLRHKSDPTGNTRAELEPGKSVERWEDSMGIGMPELVVLCGACRYLNNQRIDLDRRIATLLADDCCGDEVWRELEDVLEDLGTAAERLARVSATQLPEVRAKAEVLALLMRSSDGGPIVPQYKTEALMRSLADDLAGLPDDSAVAADRRTTRPPVAVGPAQKASNRWLPMKYIEHCRNRCH